MGLVIPRVCIIARTTNSMRRIDPRRGGREFHVDPPDAELLRLRGDDAVERVRHDMEVYRENEEDDDDDGDDIPPHVGPLKKATYFCEPLSTFQQRARMPSPRGEVIQDLQHITRMQKPEVVRRWALDGVKCQLLIPLPESVIYP